MTPLRSPLRAALGLAALAAVSACGGISQQQEVQMGAESAAQVNAQLPMLNDGTINAYVNSLGNAIARRTSRLTGSMAGPTLSA